MLEIEKYLNDGLLNKRLISIKNNISVYDFKFDKDIYLSVNNKCYFPFSMEECKNHNIIKIQVCLDKEIKFVLDNSLEFFIGLDADSCDTPEAFSLQSAENNIYIIYNNFNEIYDFR